MTDPDRSDGLDDYLKGDSAVSRAYRGGDDVAPPPAVDVAIRAAAAEAVSVRRSAFQRWRVPLAAAAAVVVSVTVAVLVEREGPPGALPPAADEYSAPPRVPAAEESKAKSPAAEPPAAEQRSLPQPAAPPERERLQSPPAPPPAAGKAAPAPQMRQQSPAKPETAEPAPAAPAAAGTIAPQGMRQEAPAASESSPAPPAQSAVPESASRAKRMAPGAEDRTSRDTGANQSGALRSAPAGAPATSLPKEGAEPPEAWLARIRQLIKDGDEPAARRELQRFIEAHPQYLLPADIAALR
jgi:hypothetical protein